MLCGRNGPMNKTLEVSELMIQRFEAEYPILDVRQLIRNMQNWWMANPKKRKQPAGEYKFVVNWLNAEYARVAAAQVRTRTYARAGTYDSQRQAPDYSKECAEIIAKYPDLVRKP